MKTTRRGFLGILSAAAAVITLPFAAKALPKETPLLFPDGTAAAPSRAPGEALPPEYWDGAKFIPVQINGRKTYMVGYAPPD